MENFPAKTSSELGIYLKEKGVPDVVCEAVEGKTLATPCNFASLASFAGLPRFVFFILRFSFMTIHDFVNANRS